MKRTTIFADDDLLAALKRIAREDGTSVADLIRRALEAFLAERKQPNRLPRIVGVGRSGRKDVSERHEELLWRKDKRRHG